LLNHSKSIANSLAVTEIVIEGWHLIAVDRLLRAKLKASCTPTELNFFGCEAPVLCLLGKEKKISDSLCSFWFLVHIGCKYILLFSCIALFQLVR